MACFQCVRRRLRCSTFQLAFFNFFRGSLFLSAIFFLRVPLIPNYFFLFFFFFCGSLSFPAVSYGAFPRLICKINPTDLLNPPPPTHTHVKIAVQIPLDDPRAIINGWAALWDNVRTLTSVNSHDEPAAVGSTPVGGGGCEMLRLDKRVVVGGGGGSCNKK